MNEFVFIDVIVNLMSLNLVFYYYVMIL